MEHAEPITRNGANHGDHQLIPLWLKTLDSAYVCILFITYGLKYGPTNYLWFSDLAMLGLAIALWLENSLLASTMTVAVLLPEMVWNASFFGHLIFGVDLTGSTNYMFEAQRPLYLRGASLFHVVLPVLLLWTVWRLGYDRRARWLAPPFGWVVLMASYRLSPREYNINWVFHPGNGPALLSPLAYLGLLMVVCPVAIYLPTHWILSKLLGRRVQGNKER